MRQLYILLVALTAASNAVACLCERTSLIEALSWADKVFIGKIVKRTDTDQVYGLVVVSQVFKGDKLDSLEIKTGFGHGDCGVGFEVGKSYVIFSKGDQTDACSGTDLVEESVFLEKLRYIFETGYAENFGQTTNSILTDKEAAYFNGELFFERSNFDFHQKKIAFMSGSSISVVIDKKQYFTHWGAKDIENSLLVLTEKEKVESGGFDAIIVSWSKIKTTRKSRKRMLAKLKAASFKS